MRIYRASFERVLTGGKWKGQPFFKLMPVGLIDGGIKEAEKASSIMKGMVIRCEGEGEMHDLKERVLLWKLSRDA